MKKKNINFHLFINLHLVLTSKNHFDASTKPDLGL